MNTAPFFTLCIPSYNAERTLGLTLDSLLSQSYRNFKIKIFDNASTDGTVALVQGYQKKFPNIELTVHPQNIGGEANFTACIQAAEGDYTGVFHSDDIYHPHMLEEALRVFRSNPEIVATGTHAKRIDFDGKILGERVCPPCVSKKEVTLFRYKELLAAVLSFGNFITCPSVIAKSTVYKNEIKKWDGTEFKTSADLDVWLRLSQLGAFAFINKPLIHYREAVDSYSYNLKKVRTVRHDIFHVLETHMERGGIRKDDTRFLFLELKDNALRTYNILKSGKEEVLPSLTPFKSSHLRLAFSDTWHLRFYVLSLCVWFYRLLK